MRSRILIFITSSSWLMVIYLITSPADDLKEYAMKSLLFGVLMSLFWHPVRNLMRRTIDKVFKKAE